MANGAIGAGLVLDLGQLDWIEPVDRDTRTIRCGPGAVRDAVNDAAREAGLRFPVDPSSGSFCTIGGMVATNAAGAHSLAYGATRPWVQSLDCVLADGSRMKFSRGDADGPDDLARALELLRDSPRPIPEHRVRKESSGYAVGPFSRSGDVLDLIVGSEGSLALIVGLELKLTPLAGATSSLLAAFDDLDAAVAGADTAREQGAAVCELLEKTFIDIARESGSIPSLPEGIEAVLLVAVEGRDADEAAERARNVAGALTAAGATHTTLAFVPAAEREVWELRHAASPILSRLDPSLRSMQFIEDGAVPPIRLADYVRGVRRSLDSHQVRGVIFGHAGDAHVHVNPLIDVAQRDWRWRVSSLLEEMTELVTSLGGTLSGEHGDGRLRAPLVSRAWAPAAVEAFRAVKAAFDPDGVLNPGVKLPSPDQESIEEVKYDPALPPLPERARRCLDFVAAQRAYAVSRLSLLEGRA